MTTIEANEVIFQAGFNQQTQAARGIKGDPRGNEYGYFCATVHTLQNDEIVIKIEHYSSTGIGQDYAMYFTTTQDFSNWASDCV